MASFVCKLSGLIALTAVFGVSVDAGLGTLVADPVSWRLEWLRTDFSKHSVPFEGIKSGGPPKDGISPIDAPRFERLERGKSTGRSGGLCDIEPVLPPSLRGEAPAYSLRRVAWTRTTTRRERPATTDFLFTRPACLFY